MKLQKEVFLGDDSEIQDLFQRGYVARATTLRRLQFTFPNNLLHFQRFDSTQQIQDQFTKQENQASIQKRNLYSKKYIPNFQQAVRVYYRCKQCKAGISFKRQNQYYRLLKVQVAHDHQPRDCRKDQKQYFLKYFNAHSDADTRELKKRLTQQLNINQRQFYYLKSLAEGVPTNSFRFVEKYLRERNFKYSLQPGSNDFPSKIIVMSDKMAKNCAKYGDAIKYVYYDCNVTSYLENSYGAIIFYGQDTNMRLVMLAAALTQKYTSEIVIGIFLDFFKISGCNPQCIATAQDPVVFQALQTMKAHNLYNGLYVFDLQVMKQKIKDTFKLLLSEQNIQIKVQQECQIVNTLRSYYKSFKYLFKQKQYQKGREAVQQLQKKVATIQDVKTQQILSQLLLHFLDTIDYTCMWSIPNGYLGYIQDVKNTVQLERDMTMIQFFKQIYRVNKSFQARYQQRFKQHIEQDYRDPRLKVIRESLQKNVLAIFLRYFRQARQELDITHMQGDQFNVNNSFQITNRNRPQEKFYIYNWVCSCGIKQRTGICCSHLLRAALETQVVSYQSLLKKRWIKGLQTRVHTRRMRKGRARRTRRNHNY